MQPPDVVENPAPLAGGNRADFEGGSVPEHSGNPADLQDGERQSNRLPVLEKAISDAHAAVQWHDRKSVESAIAAGRDLIEAKELCGHGQWLAFLQRAGVNERTAQRYMTIARAGLENDIVSYLGLAKAANYAAQGIKALPDPSQALVISATEGDDCYLGYYWREEDERFQFQAYHLIGGLALAVGGKKSWPAWMLPMFMEDLPFPVESTYRGVVPIGHAMAFIARQEGAGVQA